MLTHKDTIKFGVLVGFAAIFIDAAIAHGLFWENDPYWTYWITKTFLITTVFTLGTAFLGIGFVQGAAITVVHTLILEAYYEWFSPVGLPQEPMWLPFEDIWTLGIVAHYLSIFGGYLIALWIWRRRGFAVKASVRSFTLTVLGSAIAVLVLDGIITQGLLLREFPGVTFYIQRLLIAFVFLFGWFSYTGRDTASWATGALLLSLVWTTYSMYLSPTGLPAEDPTYLGYNALWVRSFPGSLIAALIGLWIVNAPIRRLNFPLSAAIMGLAAVLAIALPTVMPDEEGLAASASSSGEAMMVVGENPVDMDSTIPAEGTITLETVDNGNRWSHLQNIDEMDVTAEFTADGNSYQVTINQAQPRHPLGWYTTWFGVVYEAEMHGDTGIGTSKLPKVTPEIALWGWAEVSLNDEVIDRMASAHVMVMTDDPLRGVMLEVATEDKSLLALPDGYINVVWPEVGALEQPKAYERNRQWFGWLVMLGIIGLFGWLSRTAILVERYI